MPCRMIPNLSPELKAGDTNTTYQKWLHGQLSQTVWSSGPAPVGPLSRYEAVSEDDIVVADNALRIKVLYGGGRQTLQTIPASDHDPFWVAAINRDRTNFIGTFRADYRGGALADAGQSFFDGRPARRYIVTDAHAAGTGYARVSFELRTSYYVDVRSGQPLGSITDESVFGFAPSDATLGNRALLNNPSVIRAIPHSKVASANRLNSSRNGRSRHTVRLAHHLTITTVEEIRHLASTSRNVALLTRWATPRHTRSR